MVLYKIDPTEWSTYTASSVSLPKKNPVGTIIGSLSLFFFSHPNLSCQTVSLSALCFDWMISEHSGINYTYLRKNIPNVSAVSLKAQTVKEGGHVEFMALKIRQRVPFHPDM